MNPTTPASAGITAASPQAPTALPGAATAVPTFDTAGTLGAIRNYYQIPQAAAAASVQGQGLAGQSDYKNKVNETQANYAREQAAHETDASAYRLRQDPHGGPSQVYNVYTGRQVNALQFSQLTGANPADIFKNSVNKYDQTFAQDYQNYETYLQAKLNPSNQESKDLTAAFEKVHPALKKMTPEGLRIAFMNTYGPYFGGGKTTPSSTQYSPQFSPSAIQYGTERQFISGTPPLGYSFSPSSTPNSAPAGNSPISTLVQPPKTKKK